MIASDDELDAKLRQLFADDRLGGLQPKTDAGEAIVAGARRRRNRRKAVTAASGVAMAGVLVVGGVTFAKIQDRDTQAAMSTAATQAAATAAPPSSSTGEVGATAGAPASGPASPTTSAPIPGSTPPKTPPSSAAQPDGPKKVLTGQLLSHSGIGNLAVGMSEAQLTAAGITFKKETGTTCAFGTVSNVTSQAGAIRIYLSDKSGVTAILPASSHTPEGVGTGSTVQDVTALYPQASNGRTLSVNLGSTSYEFALSGPEVKGVVLKSNNSQGCG
ncbi:hypothetical protein AB5J62_44035 [Amycolatopsis sp. cg5]|uniref:hypothetical protein n=1 Tax=Amycolatopsis sp. cg5 TaxID=3238802 RepID=UPI003525A703